MATSPTPPTPGPDFIRERVIDDLKTNKHHGRVVTRFPPEPNGFLHIGHAKSICLNFGIAREFGGRCHLRLDDTNPETEEMRFVESFFADVRWLGFDWGEHLYYASDYYEQLYDFAVQLIRNGKAYVCDLSEDEVRQSRGTVTEPGRPSRWRDRPVEENLDLFARMRAGEFADGERTLRARIDMAHPNMKMRDPLMYRIRHAQHYRRGGDWCIYPMYDWAHGQSDWIERITHSLCTLEFENNRELYDWFLAALDADDRPQQIEFARLELSHTVLSKRKLQKLVSSGVVRGWDDPRMPTLAGLRRRGYSPEAIRDFATRVGVAKRDSMVDIAQLEFSLREDLNRRAPRVMAVLRPLKLVIDSYPAGQVEQFEATNNPEDAAAGSRMLPFSRELWIERDDFREDPPRKFYRLAPGREVRLKHAYLVTCVSVVKDERGEPVEVHCTHDPATRGGAAPDGRSPKATLHWVSAADAVDAEVRLYDHLFRTEHPDEIGDDVEGHLNPASLEVLTGCKVEPGLAAAAPGSTWQFLRHGYFAVDPDPGLVFNRAVGLRDSWARIEKAQGA
jgi:glutaminyl-tRNA synthetase